LLAARRAGISGRISGPAIVPTLPHHRRIRQSRASPENRGFARRRGLASPVANSGSSGASAGRGSPRWAFLATGLSRNVERRSLHLLSSYFRRRSFRALFGIKGVGVRSPWLISDWGIAHRAGDKCRRRHRIAEKRDHALRSPDRLLQGPTSAGQVARGGPRRLAALDPDLPHPGERRDLPLGHGLHLPVSERGRRRSTPEGSSS
jgi:hypothetical protein